MTTSGEPRTAAPYSMVPRVADVDEIAGVAGDEQFAHAVIAKNELGRDPAVGASDDCRPGRLVRGDGYAAFREMTEQSSGLLT